MTVVLPSSNRPLYLYHYLISWYLFINYIIIKIIKFQLGYNNYRSTLRYSRTIVIQNDFFFNTNKNLSWNVCLLVIYLQSEDNLFIPLILSEIVSFLFSIPVLLSLTHKTCESSNIVFSLFLLFRILKDLPYLSTFSCFSTYLSFNLTVLLISQWSRTYLLLIFIILICEILKYLY